jgi:hypothetical protein
MKDEDLRQDSRFGDLIFAGVRICWAQARSEHASTPDRIEDLERLVADSPAALL